MMEKKNLTSKISNSYTEYSMIYRFYKKKWKLKLVKKSFVICMIKKHEIKFNQKGWLKRYFCMKIYLRKAKNDLQTGLFKSMINAALQKTMENVGKQRNIKLVTKRRRRNYLVSESNYHITKWFTDILLYIL